MHAALVGGHLGKSPVHSTRAREFAPAPERQQLAKRRRFQFLDIHSLKRRFNILLQNCTDTRASSGLFRGPGECTLFVGERFRGLGRQGSLTDVRERTSPSCPDTGTDEATHCMQTQHFQEIRGTSSTTCSAAALRATAGSSGASKWRATATFGVHPAGGTASGCLRNPCPRTGHAPTSAHVPFDLARRHAQVHPVRTRSSVRAWIGRNRWDGCRNQFRCFSALPFRSGLKR